MMLINRISETVLQTGERAASSAAEAVRRLGSPLRYSHCWYDPAASEKKKQKQISRRTHTSLLRIPNAEFLAQVPSRRLTSILIARI